MGRDLACVFPELLEMLDQDRALAERIYPPPTFDREAREQDRQALILERRAMLDTLELSDRKKYRLLRELYERPAGEHWAHIMADLPEKEPEKKQP